MKKHINIQLALLLLQCSLISCFNFSYDELPIEYKLLISQDLYDSVVMTASDQPKIEEIFEEFDSPLPIDQILEMLKTGAPIYEEKIEGFLEKIDFQFEVIRRLHPEKISQFAYIQNRVSGYLVNEAVDFFAFTPLIDVHTFQNASSKYGPLSHVRMNEMTEQIEKLLPHVAQALHNLTSEFEAILETLCDSMLDVQLRVVKKLREKYPQYCIYTFTNIEQKLKSEVYAQTTESLRNLEKTLPFAMINSMHELRYGQMEKIWTIYGNISDKYDFEQGLNLPEFHSFDVDFLGFTVKRFLSTALNEIIEQKSISLKKILTEVGRIRESDANEVIKADHFQDRLDAIHEDLDYMLNNRLTFLLLCAIGSVPPTEHRYVRRLVAHYLPGEKLLTKVEELHENAPYLSGKVLFASKRIDAYVRWYCRKHEDVCHDLNSTTDYVTNYYMRGMLRIFDLLPDTEIDAIKKVQTEIKLEKYRYVMESLESKFPSLYEAIISIHENIEQKLGAMSYLGTQEFVRKLEADTLRVMMLLALGKNDKAEDYREYAKSWRRGFTSMGKKARAEMAAALPEFAKALATSTE